MGNKLYIALFFLFINGFNFAQERYIPSIITKEYDRAWYVQQYNSLKEKVNKEPNNEELWLNYYAAARGVLVLDHWVGEFVEITKSIIDQMGKILPNSSVYLSLKGRRFGVWERESQKFIEKAYKQNPAFKDNYSELVVSREVWSTKAKRKDAIRKWYALEPFSPGLLNFNYNVIQSMSTNGVIFTFGDNDTYPLWVLQDQFNLRNDIRIINIHLILISEYRAKVLKELGVTLDAKVEQKIQAYLASEGEQKNRAKLQQHIFDAIVKQTKRPIYIYNNPTISNPSKFHFLTDHTDNIYMIGLISQYSKTKINRLQRIKSLFENTYKLDYVMNDFYHDSQKNAVKWIHQNYIPGAILLYKHYQKNNPNKAKEMKDFILYLSKGSKNEAKILNMLKS